MSGKSVWDAIKEKATSDKTEGAPPPPAFPTQAQQNWYEENRNS